MAQGLPQSQFTPATSQNCSQLLTCSGSAVTHSGYLLRLRGLAPPLLYRPEHTWEKAVGSHPGIHHTRWKPGSWWLVSDRLRPDSWPCHSPWWRTDPQRKLHSVLWPMVEAGAFPNHQLGSSPHPRQSLRLGDPHSLQVSSGDSQNYRNGVACANPLLSSPMAGRKPTAPTHV